MIADLYELSPMQQGMLFRALEAPESRAFFNQFSCRLQGDLKQDLLRQAWQKLVDRHGVLRTSFHWEKLDKPMQVVHKQATIPWTFDDWRGVPAEVCRQRWQEHLEADLREGFRLDRPPLMRCRLARTGERDYLFSWSHHHLLMDGWCLSLVLDELFSVYAGLARGLPAKPAPVWPYRDYILWLQRQDAARTRDFWSRNLAGFTAPTPLPKASNRVDETAAADIRLAAELSHDLSGRLRALAGRHQVTAGTLIQAAWAMLLARYSGERDVVFGLTVSGRPAELPGVETMIGVFINVIPVRVRVDGTAGLIPHLAGMRAQQAERSGFEHTGLANIQRWSEVPRGQPLFESNVILINYPFRESLSRGAEGLEISEVSMFDRDHLPLTLQATPGDKWQIELLYNSSLFEAATMERALGHLQRLLEGFVEDPGRRLGEFPILTERERLQLLYEFNNTAVDFDPNRTFIHRFEEGASAGPDRMVAEFEQHRLSWGELNRRSNQLARCMLRRSPLAPDDLVAILTRRSEKLMESLLAVWKCGACYVPIDPDYPDDRIRTLLAESRPKLVVTESGMLRPSLASELEPATVLRLDTITEEWQSQDGSNLGRPVKPGDLAYVIFTSGSTGKPKGAMVEHAGMLNHLLAKVHDFGIGPDSVIVQNASHCFDISVWQFFAAPLAGGRTVIYGDSLVFDPDRFIQQVEADGVTILEVVPSYLSALLDRIGSGSGLFSRLKYLAVTGEAVKPGLLDRWFQAFPWIPVINAYGPTEASDDITHCRMDRLPDTPAIPVGKPLQNLNIYIVDDYMNLCPTGIRGEICVSGIGVGRGYLRDDAKTRAAFLEDPFRAERGVRMYRTGDVGCLLPDGNVMLFGRKDHQVKVRGHRIELGEIEAALTRLEEVEDAVVLDCHDAGRDTYLCAYLVAKGGVSLETERIARLLSQKLPDYMVPRAFVFLDQMPLTPNGKIDRKALPAPGLSRRSSQDDYVAPRTPAEEILCSVWGEALGVEMPGVRDNFFALGGDSIISMQIVARAARAGLRLRVSQIFQHQTVEELARVAAPAVARPAGEQTASGSAPLTPIQQRFFVHNKPVHNKEDLNRCSQALVLDTPSDLEPAILAQALRHVTDRHDALRLRFVCQEGRWRQEVQVPTSDVPVEVQDLSDLAPAAREAAMQQAIAGFRSGLDLTRGPLMRAGLFRMGPDLPARLLLVIHQLAVDDFSWRILIEEFQTAYLQLARGEPVRLPAKTASYVEWANQLAGYVRSGVAAASLTYWREALPPHHAVKPDANAAASIGEIAVSVDAALTQALLQDTSRAYNTRIEDLLLAALGLAVAEWTGMPRVLVDLEGRGREDYSGNIDVSRTVGWFTVLYPVWVEVDEDSLAETLKSVKEQLRCVSPHGMNYGLLRYLSDESVLRQMEALPEASVIFSYLGQTDRAISGGAPWKRASEFVPHKRHPLEINSFVAGGCLQMRWVFRRDVHDEPTIRHLANRYTAKLEALIAHCTDPASRGFTPSDFPVAKTSRQPLEALLSRLRSAGCSLHDIEDIYELTPTQQGMLFHNLREPSSPAYFNQLTCLIEGSLDVDAFREAWRAAIGRHAVLRTSFHWEELPRPLQVVHRRDRLPWRYEDFSGLSEGAAADRWHQEAERDRALPFDHGRAPLMRLAIFRMAKQTWRFVWSQHHLLLDGWSSAIVLNDVLQFHESLRTGRTIDMPQPPAFREKVRWLQRRDAASAEKFWREKLRSFDTPTPLVLGLPEMEGTRAAPHFAADEVWLSAEESSRLAALAQQYQVTLNTVAEGAWALLLSRYSGETDVVYGTIVSGRPPELEGSADMVGVFINTVPVRAQVDVSSPAMPWLRSLQANLAERDEYSDCPLADIQSWSEIPGGTPLFETLLIFENYPIQESLKRGFSDIRVSEVESFEPNNYPLSLVVTPGARLSLKVLYDEGRFDSATVRRLLGHYQCVLKSFLADPSRTVSSVSVLTDSERTQILSDWNDTAAPDPAGRTIADLFEEQAALHPEHVAVRCGSATRTYRSLSDRSQRLASHLLELAAIEADDRIAILMPRSELMVESILAVWKSGAAYVPIDPGYPADRIRTILADARPRILITSGSALPADLASAIPPDVPVVRVDRLPDLARTAINGPRCVPSSLAYVIYTSGSTGKPKGAMVEQRGMLNHILGMIRDLGIGPSSVVAQTASHCFDISVWQFFAALVAGGATVIFPDEVVAQPGRLIERVESEGVTAMQLVPSYLAALLDELQGRARKPEFARLRFLVLIGETLKPESVRRWFGFFPEIRLMNAYGPTEASDSITHYIMERAPSMAGIPVGKPVQNLRIYIVDRDMNLCPVGVKGEICVAGVGVGRGYLFDPERTRAVFAEDPFAAEPGIRLYHTGDIGCYAPDGNILFFGRKDFQVKIRGVRIELGEIESALAGLAEVQDAAVVAREDTGGNKVLCGYVTLRAGASGGPAAIQQSLRAKLPGHMIPQTIVVLPALPLTPNGKVNRRALPAPDAAVRTDSGQAFFATATERTLAGIWSDVLGHRRFGTDDRFFDIGGHSLRVIQVVSRVRRDLSAEIDLADIFSLDTIRRLAEHVDQTVRRLEADIPRAPQQEWYEVSHTQKRIWLASRTAEGSAAYHVGGAFEIRGALDRRALGRALDALVERHESLRTIYSLVNGELRQKIQTPEDFGFSIEEPHEPAAADADLLIQEESEQPFDLARGPLFRAKLVSFTERNRLLMLTMHHIVSDAWSVRVLLNDLLLLYGAYRQETGNPLPSLAIQYKDYAAWHNARLVSGELRSDRDYWLRHLSADVPRLQLKYDYRRPERMTNAGGSVAFEYDESLTESMSALARKHNVSLYVLVLSAIYVMFYRSSRQEDIVIGSQSAGRDHHLLEDQVGAYLGTVVLRLRIAGNQTIETLIGSVARMLREALEHQAYPFDLLLEEMRVRTPPNRAPLFDVQVDYVPRLGAGWAAAPDLEIADRSREADRSKFDLSFLIRESDAGRLQFLISYNSGLFRKETIETMRDRLLDIQRQLNAGDRTIDDIRWEDGGRAETSRRVHVRVKI
jgi:amino acid adenylation domain-containing protein/non-ribosomal peptide synthase protein (TIGR01720 family)